MREDGRAGATSVLSVCRSPIAGVFRKLVIDQNISGKWRIDSAETSTDGIGTSRSLRAELGEEDGVPTRHSARRLLKTLPHWIIYSARVKAI